MKTATEKLKFLKQLKYETAMLICRCIEVREADGWFFPQFDDNPVKHLTAAEEAFERLIVPLKAELYDDIKAGGL